MYISSRTNRQPLFLFIKICLLVIYNMMILKDVGGAFAKETSSTHYCHGLRFPTRHSLLIKLLLPHGCTPGSQTMGDIFIYNKIIVCKKWMNIRFPKKWSKILTSFNGKQNLQGTIRTVYPT